jgi:GrpB-like predicted nucleotidyltransferase (UPF0157 family)/predicted kinase
MIIIINGPLGIGKTETTWKLLEHFERAVMLDGDHIGAVVPFEIYDPERIEYLYQTLRHLVAWHVEHGYRNFVLDYVFEEPESLARLRHLLSDLDDEIYAFRLVCAEAEMERRIRRRARLLSIDGVDLSWELQRFRQLTQIQDEAAQRGDLGFVVDTTHLSIQGVADVIWNNIREGVDLVPYNTAWPAQFQAEKENIQSALGGLAVEIQHIGSTAIPGLEAKPVIDILVTVPKLSDAVACIAPLHELGYTFIDYPQNTDRRFFRKGLPRTHHLHIVEQGSASMHDHLDFRDALLSDPALRSEYQQLKVELAAKYKNDRAKYSDSKTEFVQRVLREWRAGFTSAAVSTSPDNP